MTCFFTPSISYLEPILWWLKLTKKKKIINFRIVSSIFIHIVKFTNPEESCKMVNVTMHKVPIHLACGSVNFGDK